MMFIQVKQFLNPIAILMAFFPFCFAQLFSFSFITPAIFIQRSLDLFSLRLTFIFKGFLRVRIKFTTVIPTTHSLRFYVIR